MGVNLSDLNYALRNKVPTRLIEDATIIDSKKFLNSMEKDVIHEYDGSNIGGISLNYPSIQTNYRSKPIVFNSYKGFRIQDGKLKPMTTENSLADLNSASVHETHHAIQEPLLASPKVKQVIGDNVLETGGYYGDPAEIYSRIMETRKAHNMVPGQEFTRDMYIKKKHQLSEVPATDEGRINLMNLLPSLAGIGLVSKSIDKKEEGGKIN